MLELLRDFATPTAVSVIVFYILIRDVLPLITKRKTRDDDYTALLLKIENIKRDIESINKCLTTLAPLIQDLYQWHNVRNGDGVPRWYVRKDLTDGMYNLNEQVNTEIQLLRDALYKLERILDKLGDRR